MALRPLIGSKVVRPRLRKTERAFWLNLARVWDQRRSALIRLIRRMSQENPLWGAPRIRSDLLLLGYGVVESTVARRRILQ